MNENDIFFNRPDRETWMLARFNQSVLLSIQDSPLWQKEDVYDIPLTEEQMFTLVRGYNPDFECRYAPYDLGGWFYITRSGYWLKKFKYEEGPDGFYHVTEHYTTEKEKGNNLLMQIIVEWYFHPRILDDRILNLIKKRERTTPELITAVEEGEVFVFGSNAQGKHMGGAARVAMERFGAVWGVGEGLQGHSYALPTMEGLDSMAVAVGRFIAFAREHSDLRFLVTAVGCGIAGYRPEQIAPLFAEAVPLGNVCLPLSFWEILA